MFFLNNYKYDVNFSDKRNKQVSQKLNSLGTKGIIIKQSVLLLL